MAEPWEQNWSQATPQAAPWEQNWSAPEAPKKSFTDKLADTWPARLVKGVAQSVYSGLTLPGDVYSGQVDPNDPKAVGRVIDMASLGASSVPKAALTAERAVTIPSIEALHTAANEGYKQARNSPLVVDAGAVGDLGRTIQSELVKKGILKDFAPDTHAVLSHIQTAEPGSVATGGNLISIREALREASQNFNNPREAKAANEAISQLDRFIAQPPEASVLAGSPSEFSKTIADARGNYAAAKRAETIEGEREIAERNAAAANSGRNVDNAIRQRLNSLTKSDQKSSGFNEDEMAQIDRVIFGSPLGNTMRHGANLLGGGGGLGAGIYAIGAQFNPLLALAPVTGLGLKYGENLLARHEVKKLEEMVRARSPLADEMAANAPTGLTPTQEAGRSLLIRALMNQGMPNYQQPDQNALITQMLRGGQR